MSDYSIAPINPIDPKQNEAYRDWLSNRITSFIQEGKLKNNEELLFDLDALKMRHLLSIGGTAASAIYGVNPYKTAKDVYEEMLQIVPPFKGNYLTRRGQALERLVAIRAAELMRSPVFLPAQSSLWMKFCIDATTWQRADIENPAGGPEEFIIQNPLKMFSCQIDALVENSRGHLVILECKTASRNPTIKGGGRLWGTGIEDWTEKGFIYDKTQGCADEPQGHMAIPYHYYVQVQWQLLCLRLQAVERGHEDGAPEFDYTYAYVAADIAGCPDVRVYAVNQDLELQYKLAHAAIAFMESNVMAQEPPLCLNYAADPIGTITKAERAAGQVTADADFMKAHREYNELLQKIDDLKDQAEEIKQQLVARMDETAEGLNEVLNEKGELLLKRTSYKRTSFDQKAMRQDHPDLYHEYAKTTEQTRVTIY